MNQSDIRADNCKTSPQGVGEVSRKKEKGFLMTLEIKSRLYKIERE